jgi:Tfp pilus assembly major pilin PilA
MYFDGTGDWLLGPASASNKLTGDFTIELWAYAVAWSGQMGMVSITNTSSSGSDGLAIYFDTSNKISFWVNGNTGTATTTATYATGTWYHIALVRNGSTNTLYVNGTSSASNSTTPTGSTPAIGIGRLYNDNTSYSLNGYIDDLRITKGYARYTANFTPPTSALITK